ncbi:MAG TPA: hypothetical protein VLC09_16120 [Polyangiaceae bacterium]|nr:hypothetical protein [Polyangiaceae bacterium]
MKRGAANERGGVMTRGGARWLPGVLLVCAACGVGGGSGEVTSPRLYLQDCAVREFDLQPRFFGANSYGDDLQIRIQRSSALSESADGLAIVVRGVSAIVGDGSADGASAGGAAGAGGDGAGQLGQALEVGMPVGVWPPGVPVVYDPSPAPVNMSLYLNDSCDEQNVAIYSVSGTITFSSLFDGDITDYSAESRLIEATFSAEFVDPRMLVPGEAPDAAVTSQVSGSFRFYYQRGQPAQPFP